MPEKYCIMPECPYCPACQFFYQDTSGCETYEDTQDLDWAVHVQRNNTKST